MGFDKLFNIARTCSQAFLDLLLSVVLHPGKLFDAGDAGGDDVLNFGWLLALLVQPHMAGNALGAQWLYAVGCFAYVCDRIFGVRWAGYGHKARSTTRIY